MLIRRSREKKENHIEVKMSGPDIIPKAAEKEIKKALCRIRRLLNKEISFRIVIVPENTDTGNEERTRKNGNTGRSVWPGLQH